MIKILIGGSPCTHWSIAQKNNRETTTEGIGWELFKNYLIAKEKFQPDFFLYENNKSEAQEIKDQISLELEVPLQYINSALVSAQKRDRFYAHNIPNVPQPKDRGINIIDILDCDKERKYFNMPNPRNTKNYIQFDVSGKGYNSEQDRAYYIDGKFGCLPAARTITKIKVYSRNEDKYFNLELDEVKALQTMPKNYIMPYYKGHVNKALGALGNGWTAEVIIHILKHMNISLDEEILVLSLYDGIGTGRYCLDKLGYKNIKYYAYEIEKYSIEVAMSNYPDIIQCGDAFQVREDNWKL